MLNPIEKFKAAILHLKRDWLILVHIVSILILLIPDYIYLQLNITFEMHYE